MALTSRSTGVTLADPAPSGGMNVAPRRVSTTTPLPENPISISTLLP